MKRKLKNILLYIGLFIIGYLLIGNLLHRVIFPENKPEVAGYFKPGQEFYSKAEGFKQKVIKQEKGFVHGYLEVDPYAPGPPKHIHDEFDEIFQIENGELSVWIDGKVVKLKPGEKLHIPKGMPHQPFNETADTIRLKGSFAFPEKFAFLLPQVYAYMDHHPDFATSPKTMMQMAMFQTAGFDSYLVEGPPVAVQKAMGYVLSPMGRLLGYKSYYKEYDINQQSITKK